MTTVRPLPRLNIVKKSRSVRPAQRPCRKVPVDAVNDVVNDVSDERTTKDRADAAAGFCGEPFADNGQLLASLSPLLFSMKLFGLYFHRQRRPARRPTDDLEWNPATTATTDAPSTRLRVYATIVLILIWLNAVRFVTVFTSSDHFGALLLLKVVVFAWFLLLAILQTAYYLASHTGRLVEVLLTLEVTEDCVRGARRAAVGLTAFSWTNFITTGTITAYIFFATGGKYDLFVAPLVTHIVPEDWMVIARVVVYLPYYFPTACSLFAQVMTHVLVYLFYHQFRNLKRNFRRALGKRGEFGGDFSAFRRRHQTLSRAVGRVDGFMKLSNVAGFVCHIVNIILILYTMMFFPESTATPVSIYINVSVLAGNSIGLLFATSAGVIVNHVVRKFIIIRLSIWDAMVRPSSVCPSVYLSIEFGHFITDGKLVESANLEEIFRVAHVTGHHCFRHFWIGDALDITLLLIIMKSATELSTVGFNADDAVGLSNVSLGFPPYGKGWLLLR